MPNKDREKLFYNFAVEIRDFLKPLWKEKHKILRLNQPISEDQKMCQFTSLFLKMVIESLGEEAYFRGGGTRFPDVKDGGFRDSEGVWHTHFWVEVDNEFIIDITANQFGAPEVIVTSLDDDRYKSNITGDELSEFACNVEKTAFSWLELYEPLTPATHSPR